MQLNSHFLCGGVSTLNPPLQHEVSTWSPETHLRACFSFYRKYARTWQRRSITERNLRFVMLGKIPSSVCGWSGVSGGGGPGGSRHSKKMTTPYLSPFSEKSPPFFGPRQEKPPKNVRKILQIPAWFCVLGCSCSFFSAPFPHIDTQSYDSKAVEIS